MAVLPNGLRETMARYGTLGLYADWQSSSREWMVAVYEDDGRLIRWTTFPTLHQCLVWAAGYDRFL